MSQNMLQLVHHMASATSLVIDSCCSRSAVGVVACVDGGAARVAEGLPAAAHHVVAALDALHHCPAEKQMRRNEQESTQVRYAVRQAVLVVFEKAMSAYRPTPGILSGKQPRAQQLQLFHAAATFCSCVCRTAASVCIGFPLPAPLGCHQTCHALL